MANSFFHFKKFTVHQDRCAMKVTTDACLFGAWCAEEIKKDKGKNALDIGTGTGLLSLMIVQKNNLSITAIDIDEEAALQAKENIAASPWPNQINVVCADVVKLSVTQKFDIIVSNPPFYEKEIESADHKKNAAHHGHALRLHELMLFIKRSLAEEGSFYLLLPFKRSKEIDAALHDHEHFVHQKIVVVPSPVHQPSRIMIKGGHRPQSISEKEIIIHDSERKYTSDFKQLLSDYYLFL